MAAPGEVSRGGPAETFLGLPRGDLAVPAAKVALVGADGGTPSRVGFHGADGIGFACPQDVADARALGDLRDRTAGRLGGERRHWRPFPRARG